MSAYDAVLTAHLEMRKAAREQRKTAKKTLGRLASAFPGCDDLLG